MRLQPKRPPIWAVALFALAGGMATSGMASAATEAKEAKPNEAKPNIMFIMADDIGIMNVGAYHRGLMVGETPNIDRIAKEGGMFMDYYAM